MKSIIMIIMTVLPSLSFGLERAVLCTWDTGNIMFAVTVKPEQVLIDKTMEGVRVFIPNVLAKVIRAQVTLNEGGKVVEKPAVCRSVLE